MRNFNQGGSSIGSPRGGSRFGGGNRGGGSRFGGGGSGRPGSDRGGPVTMHHAVCSTCGKDCEVPFRPTGDKPIYCNDCFSANRSPRKDFGGSAFSPRTGGDRFPRKDFGGSGDNEVKKQLEFLGLKIDRLTKVVESLANVKVAPSKEKSAQVKEALGDLAVSEEVKVKTPANKKASKKVAKKKG